MGKPLLLHEVLVKVLTFTRNSLIYFNSTNLYTLNYIHLPGQMLQTGYSHG